MKIEIEFPLVRVFVDYHEIDVFKDTLCDITEQQVKSKMVCFWEPNGLYVGAFWIGELSDFEDIIREKTQKYMS